MPELPLIEVEVVPERSFWAAINNMQINQCLSSEDVARRIGVAVDLLKAKMTFYRFYDDDGINCFELAIA